MKRKRPDKMEEFADEGVPYLVSADDLRALGIDPDQYFKSGRSRGRSWAGWMLDREKDAALIERLQSRTEPHGTVQ